jgi:hypothetical protein
VLPAAGSAASSAIPQPGGKLTVLESVACTSAGNCWAAGTASNGTVEDPTPARTVALHWNGSVWSVVPTPSPGGTAAGDSSDLFGVTCVSPADCRAVGSYSSGSHHRNLVLLWNEHAWSAATTPDPLASRRAVQRPLHLVRQLLGSAGCISAADCWAVGSFSRSALVPDHNRSNQILHWNGAS